MTEAGIWRLPALFLTILIYGLLTNPLFPLILARMNDEQMQEIKRHFSVVAEELKREISIVAEGHDVIRNEMGTFRNEVKQEFKELGALVKFSYAELDQRINTLEQEVSRSKSRLDRLERQIGAA